MGGQTLRPNAPEWRIHPSGVRHAIVRRGDTRYACGEPVLDPRFAGSDRASSFCPECVDTAGMTVRAPAPRQELLGWSESELRLADGNR